MPLENVQKPRLPGAALPVPSRLASAWKGQGEAVHAHFAGDMSGREPVTPAPSQQDS